MVRAEAVVSSAAVAAADGDLRLSLMGKCHPFECALQCGTMREAFELYLKQAKSTEDFWFFVHATAFALSGVGTDQGEAGLDDDASTPSQSLHSATTSLRRGGDSSSKRVLS